jgi:hypothetical protein
MTLKDCKIEPTMNLIFNGVNYSIGKLAQLKWESIDLMEAEFKKIKNIKITEIKTKIEREIRSRQNQKEESERENLNILEMRTNDPRLITLKRI